MDRSRIQISRLLVLGILYLLPALALAQGGFVLGDVIYVDFGASSTTTSGNWNNMTSAYGTITDAVTENGVTTGIDFALPVRFNGVNENGTTTPDASLGFPASATRDSFYGNDVTWSGLIIPNSQLVISGLDSSSSYEVTFFASRMSVSDNRQTEYAISGKDGLIETLYLDPGNNTDTAVTSSAIRPDATGAITIDIQKGPENTNSYGFFYLGTLALRVAMNMAATQPDPALDATDVVRDVTLSWTPGESAVTHDVYFGTDLEAVTNASADNPLGVLVSTGQTDSSYQPEALLEYGQVYYWRVDEVNGAPDYTVSKGELWSFTTEPYAYPITGITATASSSAQANMGPENTANSSGLDGDLHSTVSTDMWLSSSTGAQPAWIQYEFDQAYKLYELLVWNYNVEFESALGYGFKEVLIEYSLDGIEWTTLNTVQFAQATAAAEYAPNTTVSLGGVVAQYVRLTANSNWSTLGLTQCGLSEVRFCYVPVLAREPEPADAETDVRVDVTLNWRPGHEATSHTLYLDADADAVANGTADATSLTAHSYAVDSLDFATTYYWRIDEVGDAGTYEGDVWSFTTQQYASIDDFESYDDDDRIYYTWTDGYDDHSSGSQVGYTNSPFAEQTIVHGGEQAMPLIYDNAATPYYSEALRTFDSAQNWTVNGANTLSLYFRGMMPAFEELSSGAILMNGVGEDIWATADQFRFAYKSLSGDGSIVARVNSIYESHSWAKVGVMIRQNLDSGSTHAFMAKTPSGGNGAAFQRRLTAAGSTTNTDSSTAVGFPYWVKVQRVGSAFSAYTSPDGATWTQVGTTETISMSNPILIGLAVCSHDASVVTGGEFSDVVTTGSVTGSWQQAEIGLAQVAGNSPEPVYVTLKDSSGKSTTVTHPDTMATAQMEWQQWQIPLSDVTAAGVKATAIKSMVVGVGSKTSPTVGGTGTLYIDDIAYGAPLP